MNTDMIPTENDMPTLAIEDGIVMADSRDVAQRFGKRHGDVLRAIEKLDCSAEFTERNFASSEYRDSTGRTLPRYTMTRDGFTILAMGFTGKAAMEWKEKYIATFNMMEREILTQGSLVADTPTAVQALEAALMMAKRAEKAEVALAAAQDDVFALERIAKSDGSLCITDAAKALQMRPKDLFTWMRSNCWIYRRAGNSHDVAYQDKLKTLVLEHKVTTVNRTDGSEKVTEQVRVTPKGLERLAKAIAPTA